MLDNMEQFIFKSWVPNCLTCAKSPVSISAMDKPKHSLFKMPLSSVGKGTDVDDP